MKYLDIADVQNDLLTLLDELAVNPEEVMITRNGIAVAMILPFEGAKPGVSKPHSLQGKPIYIAEDFDEPQPELWEALNE